MRRTILVFVAANALGFILLVLSGWWFDTACLPFDIHTSKWQCEMQLPFLGLSFALPGALFGFFARHNPWLGGVGVAFVMVIVAVTFTGLLRPYYGSNIFAAVVSAVFYAVLPAVLASVGAFSIREVSRERNSL
jgi:hypothetical protein